MIKAVTFDLWQTLISEKAEEEERRRRLRFQRMLAVLREAGQEASEEALQEAYKACGARLREVWQEDRDVTTREQVAWVVQDLGLNEPLSEQTWQGLEEAYVSPIRDIPPVVLLGASETLETLTASGYRLGLICNTGRTPGRALRLLLQGMGLGHAFRAMAFSDEWRIRKPDPRIFHMVLKQLETAPGEAVHVGDIAETDVDGAKRAGMMALNLVRDGRAGTPEADGLVRSIAEVPEWIKGR